MDKWSHLRPALSGSQTATAHVLLLPEIMIWRVRAGPPVNRRFALCGRRRAMFRDPVRSRDMARRGAADAVERLFVVPDPL